MSAYAQCPECNRWSWLPHKCAPLWEWLADKTLVAEDDWSSVRARDAKEAAETAGEEWDQEDHYLIRSGQPTTITIRNPRTQEVTRWAVSGEAVPQYRATQITEASADTAEARKAR